MVIVDENDTEHKYNLLAEIILNLHSQTLWDRFFMLASSNNPNAYPVVNSIIEPLLIQPIKIDHLIARYLYDDVFEITYQNDFENPTDTNVKLLSYNSLNEGVQNLLVAMSKYHFEYDYVKEQVNLFLSSLEHFLTIKDVNKKLIIS